MYDLLYQDKDYPGEATYVSQLIRKHAPEAGCHFGAWFRDR